MVILSCSNMQSEAKLRSRAPNFSNTENLILYDCINKYKHIIENKKIDRASLAQKHNAWREVAKEFNSITAGYNRTAESLQQNYKNMKKKTKKWSTISRMDLTEDKTEEVEDCGTSANGWEKISSATAVPTNPWQESFMEMAEESDTQGRESRNANMHDSAPSITGCYTMYDADSSRNTPSEDVKPAEIILGGADELPTVEAGAKGESEQSDYFRHDSDNLIKSHDPLLIRKRKVQSSGREAVAYKIKLLAAEELAMASAQKQVIQIQLLNEQETLEHNRLLRKMELEDAQRKYQHNETVRKLQLKKCLNIYNNFTLEE
ncbi:uncharacterized protein LOC129247492 isoform X1 [Anastrepha obliqua]|uniref:uncharacterized protein LOC129247492 isoform X1 n=1 Tax=Anastrepha obliqua TaxID=95512 RepID=UPI00240A9064|nr:uncharacterized protein LOC129247492 isoform X1 [Anastrepha obliqua]XP_054742611.1 uncharacterized protein LOC129247492 isoform X1 [Anastrepha obliqua]